MAHPFACDEIDCCKEFPVRSSTTLLAGSCDDSRTVPVVIGVTGSPRLPVTPSHRRPVSHLPVALSREYLWYEAENMRGFSTGRWESLFLIPRI